MSQLFSPEYCGYKGCDKPSTKFFDIFDVTYGYCDEHYHEVVHNKWNGLARLKIRSLKAFLGERAKTPEERAERCRKMRVGLPYNQ